MGKDYSFNMIEHLHKSQTLMLTQLAYSFVHDWDTAKDIVGDAFLSLIEHRDDVAPEKYNDYLFIIVRNRSISFRRSDTVHKDIHDKILREEQAMMEHYTRAIENSTLSVVHSSEIMAIYRRVLNDADPLSRTIFEKKRRDGSTNKEIARELGLSENKVKYEVQKLLAQLHLALRDYKEYFAALILSATALF